MNLSWTRRPTKSDLTRLAAALPEPTRPHQSTTASASILSHARDIALLRMCLIKGLFTSAEFQDEWDKATLEMQERPAIKALNERSAS